MKNKTFLKLLPLLFVILLFGSCTAKKKCDTCPKWSKVSSENITDFNFLA